jgi:hypothetical protein
VKGNNSNFNIMIIEDEKEQELDKNYNTNNKTEDGSLKKYSIMKNLKLYGSSTN